jgi:hypothetical protein
MKHISPLHLPRSFEGWVFRRLNSDNYDPDLKNVTKWQKRHMRWNPETEHLTFHENSIRKTEALWIIPIHQIQSVRLMHCSVANRMIGDIDDDVSPLWAKIREFTLKLKYKAAKGEILSLKCLGSRGQFYDIEIAPITMSETIYWHNVLSAVLNAAWFSNISSVVPHLIERESYLDEAKSLKVVSKRAGVLVPSPPTEPIPSIPEHEDDTEYDERSPLSPKHQIFEISAESLAKQAPSSDMSDHNSHQKPLPESPQPKFYQNAKVIRHKTQNRPTLSVLAFDNQVGEEMLASPVTKPATIRKNGRKITTMSIILTRFFEKQQDNRDSNGSVLKSNVVKELNTLEERLMVLADTIKDRPVSLVNWLKMK